MNKLRVFVFFLLSFLLMLSGIGLAQEEQAEQAEPGALSHRFGLELAGGYTPLPLADYRYNLDVFTDCRRNCRTDDESTLEANAMYGLGLAYYPQSRWLSFGLIMEALYARYEGELTGRESCPESVSHTYKYDQSLTFYQLNWLLRLYLSRKAVQPFVEVGPGVVRVDASFDGYDQASYGLTALMGWGVHWRIHDLVGISLQARLADHFGLVYYFEPAADRLATIEAQYIPMSLLFKAHLFF